MISHVLFAAVILVFAIAHGVALQKMHAIEDVNRTPLAATVTNGD
jgi:hypothetical protein